MKLELEFGEFFCYTPKFVVNGMNADSYDFGEQYDIDPDEAEPYGCGYMKFTRIYPTKKVLDKYGITESEYSIIAGQLEEGLSFGSCGLCT